MSLIDGATIAAIDIGFARGATSAAGGIGVEATHQSNVLELGGLQERVGFRAVAHHHCLVSEPRLESSIVAIRRSIVLMASRLESLA